MKRRTIDASKLASLVQSSATQEIQKGTPRTTDPNFPLFATPVNSTVLVYIPKVNVVSDESGTRMDMLNSHIHETKVGKSFGSHRCINGLSGNEAFDEMGYDGTCPSCEAMREVWELYNLKLDAEAKRLGVDRENDPNDTLKSVREPLLRDMALKAPEAFVTFPVVIIPTKSRFEMADDAMDNIKVVFVHWRKKRYEEHIQKALDSMVKNPGHPGGMFFSWDFTYNTDGKQANAMLSAKNMKITAITDADALSDYAKVVPVAENLAKDFTVLKAAEVVVATQFMYREDIEAEVNRVLKPTREMLNLAKAGGAPALGAPAQGAIGANPLASFGATAPTGDMGTAPAEAVGAISFGQPAGQ